MAHGIFRIAAEFLSGCGEIVATAVLETSQVLFARGWVEMNPRFTISGRPNDVPVAYGAGKRIIRREARSLLQNSAVNNLAEGIGERLLASLCAQILGHLAAVVRRLLPARSSNELEASNFLKRMPNDVYIRADIGY